MVTRCRAWSLGYLDLGCLVALDCILKTGQLIAATCWELPSAHLRPDPELTSAWPEFHCLFICCLHIDIRLWPQLLPAHSAISTDPADSEEWRQDISTPPFPMVEDTRTSRLLSTKLQQRAESMQGMWVRAGKIWDRQQDTVIYFYPYSSAQDKIKAEETKVEEMQE